MTTSAEKPETKSREIPKAPHHLSSKMKQFWTWAYSTKPTLTEKERLLLVAACEARDRCEQARRAIKKNGTICKDRFGQERARPEIQIEKDSRTLFAKLIGELHFPQKW